LLEDQLFGHVRGAYTGADKDREGVFEYGDRGSVFLDEIGDTPLSMQPKLLRVLEKGEIVRLGSNDARKVDVRFISATNRDLRTMIKQGQFREDLFYRLRGVEINIPPLRERREDIPLLVRHALGRFARELDRVIPTISEPAMLRLVAFQWPGNVRELMNIVHRMMVGSSANVLDVQDVPAEIHVTDSDDAAMGVSSGLGGLAGCGLGRLEKEAIRQTLAMAEGNREKAAQMLGIGERTLYRKLKEYGLR
jgi:two-component system response regulator HydG